MLFIRKKFLDGLSTILNKVYKTASMLSNSLEFFLLNLPLIICGLFFRPMANFGLKTLTSIFIIFFFAFLWKVLNQKYQLNESYADWKHWWLRHFMIIFNLFAALAIIYIPNMPREYPDFSQISELRSSNIKDLNSSVMNLDSNVIVEDKKDSSSTIGTGTKEKDKDFDVIIEKNLNKFSSYFNKKGKINFHEFLFSLVISLINSCYLFFSRLYIQRYREKYSFLINLEKKPDDYSKFEDFFKYGINKESFSTSLVESFYPETISAVDRLRTAELLNRTAKEADLEYITEFWFDSLCERYIRPYIEYNFFYIIYKFLITLAFMIAYIASILSFSFLSVFLSYGLVVFFTVIFDILKNYIHSFFLNNNPSKWKVKESTT